MNTEEEKKLMSLFLLHSNKKNTCSIVNVSNSRNIVNPMSCDHTFIVETDIITLSKIPDGYTITILNKNRTESNQEVNFTIPSLVTEESNGETIYTSVPENTILNLPRLGEISLFTSQPLYIVNMDFVYTELRSFYVRNTMILKSHNGCLYQVNNPDISLG